jgi:hypothetical protein
LPCAKRKLGQEPERVYERGIVRGVFQAALRGVKCRGGDVGSLDAGPDQADDILPVPRTRKPAEPSVAHARSPVRCKLSEFVRSRRFYQISSIRCNIGQVASEKLGSPTWPHPGMTLRTVVRSPSCCRAWMMLPGRQSES